MLPRPTHQGSLLVLGALQRRLGLSPSLSFFSSVPDGPPSTLPTTTSSLGPSTTPDDFDPACDPDHPRLLTFDQIAVASAAIKSGIIRSDCRRSFHLSNLTGMDVRLKLELNQLTGSFKERGARFALTRLSPEQKKIGVIAASAGNHSQALSYHGKELGIPVTVVMPRHASINKIEKCVSFGANVVIQGKDFAAAKQHAFALARESTALYINGYDHIDVLAGYGSVGIELLDQLGKLDAVVVPVGGGGLIAGIATAVKTLSPSTRVIGVESENAPGFTASLNAGRPTLTPVIPSLAEGLAVSLIGCNAFYNAQDRIDRMVTVSERDIAVAVLRLMELEKLVAEGAGAAPVAAILSGQLDFLKDSRVALVISGGNIDSSAVDRCILRGMFFDQRYVRFQVIVSNRPSALAELLEIIGNLGVSVKTTRTSTAWHRTDIFSGRASIVAETRGREHTQQLKEALFKRYGAADCIFIDESS